MIGLLALARSLVRGTRSFANDPQSRGILTIAVGIIVGAVITEIAGHVIRANADQREQPPDTK